MCTTMWLYMYLKEWVWGSIYHSMGFEIRYTIFSSSTHQKLLNRKFMFTLYLFMIINIQLSLLRIAIWSLTFNMQSMGTCSSDILLTFGVNNDTFTSITETSNVTIEICFKTKFGNTFFLNVFKSYINLGKLIFTFISGKLQL